MERMAKEKGQTKMKTAGRPPKNDPTDADAIKAKIDAYFLGLDTDSKYPSFSGLALALGYSSRTALWEASKRQSDISEPIKNAMLRIEESYEMQLRTTSPTGAIFALKNRGWVDRSEVDLSGSVSTGKMTPQERKARINALKAKLDR